MTAIHLHNINKFFGSGSARVHVLKDLDFQAEYGELVLILGPSGSGKSTFLTIAGGLQTPSTGTVSIADQQIDQLTPQQREQVRLNKIGFVLQSSSLVPYLDVADQFALVDRVKKGNLSPQELDRLLKQLGIAELKHKFPEQLSGGQKQRVAIARALYADPAIILADEPTAALDSPRVRETGQLLQAVVHQQHKAVVVVTHDLRLKDFADKIYTLNDGKLTITR
ncbi:ABC transporter ATP-binding protein [Ligilactobacillus saerimneri]|uniref:Putative hemin import ATP-binding protein HrtA n=1 Tax=Ligilactobacillus saerimneri 30a TaxID=1227363 RepID=M5J7P7_9LACO|nr:ABC transporter ATP-binding protein [Ligilactobacillus saerimneri]EKW98904.1 phosphonate-transporting ATPase [Ligilactobacillus saerimneri 30a]KRL74041.1 ABC superfamily ATP binding cassette transporter, ABC protein [Ligilactobacillus saerimneri DSM 16049]MCZ0891316.1 ABC transporter ATP-binding protein [Ligilactobacillus saerimneri]